MVQHHQKQQGRYWSRIMALCCSTVYVLEMIILLCSLPTFVILMRALWCSGEISLVEQQLVMFTAPSNVALLIYSSTLSGRILGLVGIFAVYWLFYDVKVTVDK